VAQEKKGIMIDHTQSKVLEPADAPDDISGKALLLREANRSLEGPIKTLEGNVVAVSEKASARLSNLLAAAGFDVNSQFFCIFP
jgi:hypothetical protein